MAAIVKTANAIPVYLVILASLASLLDPITPPLFDSPVTTFPPSFPSCNNTKNAIVIAENLINEYKNDIEFLKRNNAEFD